MKELHLSIVSPEKSNRLDVLIHLAGTETNLKTNAFMRLVALSPNLFTSSLWIMAL